MSASFRPVRVEWGEHSSEFVEHAVLLGLLADVAARCDTSCREESYADLIEVWIEHGDDFLNYVQRDKRFNTKSLAESLTEEGFVVTEAELEPLVSNMKQLAVKWRDSLGSDGELRFYVE